MNVAASTLPFFGDISVIVFDSFLLHWSGSSGSTPAYRWVVSNRRMYNLSKAPANCTGKNEQRVWIYVDEEIGTAQEFREGHFQSGSLDYCSLYQRRSQTVLNVKHSSNINVGQN